MIAEVARPVERPGYQCEAGQRNIFFQTDPTAEMLANRPHADRRAGNNECAGKPVAVTRVCSRFSSGEVYNSFGQAKCT